MAEKKLAEKKLAEKKFDPAPHDKHAVDPTAAARVTALVRPPTWAASVMCTVARGSSAVPRLERTTLTVTLVVGVRVDTPGVATPVGDGSAGGDSRTEVRTS